jgi:hypothetical protein
MRKSVVFILLLTTFFAHAQEKKYKVGVVAFYNLENFFDTIDDPKINDAEFLPNGERHYNSAIYQDKVSHLSDVLSQIGTDVSPDGFSMLGVAEVENQKVLEDLIAQPKLANRHYQIVHYDSPDARGIDVGLIYNPKYFKVLHSEPLFVKLENPDGSLYYTRDVLWVAGVYDGEVIHVFVNHWPSRRGGEEASAPSRAIAAAASKRVIDSLMQIDPKTKVIVMGDLNDDPVSPSVAKVLGAKGNESAVKAGGLYNPWVDFYKNGIGTLAYQDSWNLFDQIMFSYGWLDKKQSGFFFHQAHIFNKQFMVTKTGRYKGYPMRTYDGVIYNGGYSDHFPTYGILLKEVKN